MEQEIDLLELIQVLLKRKWIIVISTILAGTIAFGYTYYLVTPVYESQTTLMVNGAKSSSISDIAANFDLSSINMSQKLVVTYSEIVRSRKVLEQVIERLDLDYTYNELKSIVTAKPVNTTEILNITVTHEEPQKAADIANAIADVFIKEVIRIMKVNNVEIIDEAIPIYTDVNVHTLLNTAIGIVLGLMVGVGIAFLIYFLDQSIKTEEDVRKYLELPVLGAIMNFEEDKKKVGKA